MTKSDLKFLEDVCKEFKIKFKLLPHETGGYAMPWKGTIYVSSIIKGDVFRSVVLHEIVHCLNYRNKKYYIYHIDPHDKRRSKKYLKKFALRAEVYTDTVAKKLSRRKKYKIKKYHQFYFFNDFCRKNLKYYYGY